MYIVEGNIGVGKSTFLAQLHKQCPEISVMQEPLDNWTSQAYGQSLLERFYQNPHRWAYTIETHVMITRVRDHLQQQMHENPNRVMERSIYSGHYCFALNDFKNGYFNDIEWEIYSNWIEFFLRQRCKPPRGFIYLRADPAICIQRVTKRNRSSEKDLSLNYIKQMHNRHEAFLIAKDGLFDHLKKVPVLVLDCNETFENSEQIIEKHLNKIKNFLK